MDSMLPTPISTPPNQPKFTVRQLNKPEELFQYQTQLCQLLQDCVNEGSSIGFLSPLENEEANQYWNQVSETLLKGNLDLFIITSPPNLFSHSLTVLGTIQLVTIPKVTHRHRGEVIKLLVSPSVRRLGIAKQLINHVEETARGQGKEFLTLDTATKSAAVEMYRRLGWEEWGTCRDYACWPDGSRCDATFFRKEILKKSETERK